jgi:hypothetical protein
MENVSFPLFAHRQPQQFERRPDAMLSIASGFIQTVHADSVIVTSPVPAVTQPEAAYFKKYKS